MSEATRKVHTGIFFSNGRPGRDQRPRVRWPSVAYSFLNVLPSAEERRNGLATVQDRHGPTGPFVELVICEELGVQGCRFTLAGDAVLTRVLLQQRHRQLPEQGEVGCAVPVLHA